MVREGLECTAALQVAVQMVVAVVEPSSVGMEGTADMAVAVGPCTHMVDNMAAGTDSLGDVEEPWEKHAREDLVLAALAASPTRFCCCYLLVLGLARPFFEDRWMGRMSVQLAVAREC